VVDIGERAPAEAGQVWGRVLLASRRAALAIVDHRKLKGHEPPDDAPGPVPIDLRGRH
jgi:hypothetical protein